MKIATWNIESETSVMIIREGGPVEQDANVPVYVLEYLLGQYCNSEDEQIINDGVDNVKRILANNYVRPDEAQKVLSTLRKRGAYTVIDKISVQLNIKDLQKHSSL